MDGRWTPLRRCVMITLIHRHRHRLLRQSLILMHRLIHRHRLTITQRGSLRYTQTAHTHTQTEHSDNHSHTDHSSLTAGDQLMNYSQEVSQPWLQEVTD